MGHSLGGSVVIRSDKQTGQPIWPEIDKLISEYANIRVPVLIAYGEWDETLPAAMGNKLKDEIAGAWLVKIPRRGHSLPTEDPEVCARLIRWFHNSCNVQEFAGTPLKLYAPTRPLSLADNPTQK